ncbi:MAG: hypothetical protein R3236_05405 [Phycisphaeraceae bacterium]|nr:hypothetical protein [Phycisphaeraceae bacterium]
MYGTHQRRQWDANVRSERILMADDNNASGSGQLGLLHTTTKHSPPGLRTADRLSMNENSSNHGAEGQVFLFGDGHAEFASDPFQGLLGDNAYAADIQTEPEGQEIASPPFLKNDQSRLVQIRRDSMLLPVTGASGGRSTLDPSD